MQHLLRLSKFIDAFTGRVGIVAYWLLPLMVLIGTWNVFGRHFGQWIGTNLTSNVLLEAQWYLFSLLFLLGAPYALLHNEHVRVDVLYARLGHKKQAIINLIGTLFFLIPFCLIIAYFSWSFVAASWAILEDSPDPGGLPRYPIKTMIPIGMVLLIIQAVSEIIKNTALLTGTLPLEEQDAEEEQAYPHISALARVSEPSLSTENHQPRDDLPQPHMQEQSEQAHQDISSQQEDALVEERPLAHQEQSQERSA